jgi:DNA processing protein
MTSVRLTEDQRLAWLRLIRSENVGPRLFWSLLSRHGSAEAALEALPALARRGGAASPVRIGRRDEAERELAQAAALGVTLVARGEPDYPYRLSVIDDAPPLIGVSGSVAALSLPSVAIVGSRNASAAGVKFAEHLARELGKAGFHVVSGLARGIDAGAHRGSLTTGTIAVLAGGHAHPYPSEHGELLAAITRNGAAISETAVGHKPRGRDFPRRNRLISGLAFGVVVVEAARRSGSLITARLALEQGREVFAVPGSPLDPRAEGTNGLIKQGAAVVTEPADVLDVLQPLHHRATEPFVAPQLPVLDPTTEDPHRLITFLGATPVSIDELVRLSGVPAPSVRSLLLELSVAGRVDWQPGDLVALKPV